MIKAIGRYLVTSEFQKRQPKADPPQVENSDSPLLSDESKRGGQDRPARKQAENSDVTPVLSFAPSLEIAERFQGLNPGNALHSTGQNYRA